MGRVLFAGIDVGASATKAALLAPDGSVAGKAVVSSGFDFTKASSAALEAAISDAGASSADVACTVSTGYGRKNVAAANSARTEIACHAKGAYHYFPEAITVVDIGGQDNKTITVSAQGKRLDFKMNRKCAAGTGAFLEEIARRIEVPMSEMETLARQSTKEVEIGSFCTVFSATEILALVRRGTAVPDIVKGAFRSVAKRVSEMHSFTGTTVATGGVVAHNPIVLDILSEIIGAKVLTPPHPQFCGAVGAALYAMEDSAGSNKINNTAV
jgi:predicted CoA-substrate-specific enzyme activase